MLSVNCNSTTSNLTIAINDSGLETVIVDTAMMASDDITSAHRESQNSPWCNGIYTVSSGGQGVIR